MTVGKVLSVVFVNVMTLLSFFRFKATPDKVYGFFFFSFFGEKVCVTVTDG